MPELAARRQQRRRIALSRRVDGRIEQDEGEGVAIRPAPGGARPRERRARRCDSGLGRPSAEETERRQPGGDPSAKGAPPPNRPTASNGCEHRLLIGDHRLSANANCFRTERKEQRTPSPRRFLAGELGALAPLIRGETRTAGRRRRDRPRRRGAWDRVPPPGWRPPPPRRASGWRSWRRPPGSAKSPHER